MNYTTRMEYYQGKRDFTCRCHSCGFMSRSPRLDDAVAHMMRHQELNHK